MLTIAMTVSCRRPRYLRRAVNSWAAARGDKRLLLSCEPARREFGLGEFRRWLRSFPGETEVDPSPVHLGCSANTARAVSLALRRDSFAVLAEEDIEVADDVVEYFTWAREVYRDDPSVLAVCAHVKDSGRGEDEVIRAPWFSPLVWGTWADRWENLLAGPWQGYQDSWDALVRTVRYERGLVCVFPARSRSLHFGESSCCTPRQASGEPNYFHRTALSSCYSAHYEPQQYREAKDADVVLY